MSGGNVVRLSRDRIRDVLSGLRARQLARIRIPFGDLMPTDFPPRKDADLLTMATDASALITATPTAYALSTLQASTLAGLVTSYSNALSAAQGPTTRTTPKIAAKNATKLALTQNLRDLNRYVQANKTVSDEKKLEINFPVYAQRTPINPPTTAPVVKSVVTVGRRTKMVLRDVDGDRRSRPTGVQGALIVSYIGAVPPADLQQWRIEGMATRTDFEITWSPSIPANSQVWVATAWYSPRGAAGPVCDPISVAIGGGVSAVPSANTATFKEAA